MSFRKLGAWAFLGLLILGAIPFVSHNASAMAPTITKYGVLPTYGDVGSTVFHFFLTYTDADNDSPSAGYPKGVKGVLTTYTWPSFLFVKNDSGDTDYTDGCAYYYNYFYFPIIGSTIWNFEVKSGADAVVRRLVAATTNAVLPSTPEPYNLFPQSNEPGQFAFTFNYTSEWGLTPFHVNITIDGLSHNMIANNTGDTIYIDGKDYYFTTNLTAGLHTYSFQWKEVAEVYPERTTADHWLLLQEPSMNISIGAILIVGLIVFAMVILWVKR